jgi:hypothetical protein
MSRQARAFGQHCGPSKSQTARMLRIRARTLDRPVPLLHYRGTLSIPRYEEMGPGWSIPGQLGPSIHTQRERGCETASAGITEKSPVPTARGPKFGA